MSLMTHEAIAALQKQFPQAKLDGIEGVAAAVNYWFDDAKANDPEAIRQAMMTAALWLTGYAPSPGFFSWHNQEQTADEGWKVHVAMKDYQEYEELIAIVLPELRAINVSHKVPTPRRVSWWTQDVHYQADREQTVRAYDCQDYKDYMAFVQQGKGITIYPNNLDFLRLLSPRAQSYLEQNSGIDIITDHHLGGKVFCRYTGFRTDRVQGREVPRGLTTWNPLGLPTPPSIWELFGRSVEVHTDQTGDFLTAHVRIAAN